MSDKKDPVKWAGKNVIAKIGGKETKLYCVQVHGGIATLQGAETHEVKVDDILREA